MARYQIIKSDEPVRGIVITRNHGEYVAEYYCDNEFGAYVKEKEIGLGEHLEITLTELAKKAREALNKPKVKVYFDKWFFGEHMKVVF